MDENPNMQKFTLWAVIGLFAYLFGAFAYNLYVPTPPKTYPFFIEGRSMEQYGIFDGQYVQTVLETPNLNDTVVFDCVKFGCQPYPYIYIKKLVDIRDDGCYWVEGNKEPWYDEQAGGWMTSNDSRTFGWLCPEQINIQGVIHETKNYSPVRSSNVNAAYLSPAR